MRLRSFGVALVAALALSLAAPVAAFAAGPSASISVADSNLRIGETTTVTISFGEPVTGFTNADLSVPNGTLSAVSSLDGGATWSATFTPSVNISDPTNVIRLDNAGVSNIGGTAGIGFSTSANFSIDTERPSGTVVVAANSLRVDQTAPVTISFNEPITGLSTADLTVGNGSVSNLSSSDGGITWSATLTPQPGVTSATNVVALDNSGVADTSGNAGSGFTYSDNYAVDTQRPTATIVVADSSLTAGETSLVTITFSEPVTGFTNADLVVPNGVLSAVSSADGGITWTAMFTPTAGVSDATNTVSLDNTGISDAAGNSGSGPTSSANYAINTIRPTATVTLSDSALATGETSDVTFAFSEAVAGFSNADVTAQSGTLSTVTSLDGGVTYSATFTPAANTSTSTNNILVDLTGVTTAAGNSGLGSAASAPYSVDTAPATLTIVVANTQLTAGKTSVVTFAFSRAVTGFSNANITVGNGTLSAVTSVDGGVTFTALLTPTVNVNDASNVISVDLAGVLDSAGNAPASSVAVSNSYAVLAVEAAAVTGGTSLPVTGLNVELPLLLALLLLMSGLGVGLLRRRLRN